MAEPATSIIAITGQFSARHRCAEAEMHPHTWHVRAWFEVPYRADARCYRASLDALLSSWDGTGLPEHLEWSEDIARAVYQLANCVAVVVDRPGERIATMWPPVALGVVA